MKEPIHHNSSHFAPISDALSPAQAKVIAALAQGQDRKSTRLNSSHLVISYAVFCLKKKNVLHDGHAVGVSGHDDVRHVTVDEERPRLETDDLGGQHEAVVSSDREVISYPNVDHPV